MGIGIFRSGRRSRAGQAVVEFALILPVFALLIFGALELGRAYYCKHILTNAAREGARRGSLPNQLDGDVQDTVNLFVIDVGLGGPCTTAAVVKDIDGVVRVGGLASAQEGDRVTVTVSYTFNVLVGGIVPGLNGTVPLSSACTMRHE